MDRDKTISGTNFSGKYLEWDSDYFGISSARINLTGAAGKDEQDQIIDYAKGFEFTTISNAGNIKDNNMWIGKRTNAFLTDVNVQFTKKTEYVGSFSVSYPRKVIIENNMPGNEQILEIARTSFSVSRFFNDPYLPETEAGNVYFHWTESAFNKEDKFFAYCSEDDRIIGYLLFSKDDLNSEAVIELIAVASSFRGQRAGEFLILSAGDHLRNIGIETLKVGTQINNSDAVRFYAKNGFVYTGCSSVYHLWN